LFRVLFTILAMLAAAPIGALADPVSISINDKGAATFTPCVDVHVEGFERTDYLVDTGASYMTIDQHTLAILQANGNATYIKRLQGVFADGRTITCLFIASAPPISTVCAGLRTYMWPYFRGGSRSLLGLSALWKTALFRSR
jgi:hypothetical protein